MKFSLFYLDDDLKYGVLKNLCKFLEVVGFAQKQSFIDIFLQVQVRFHGEILGIFMFFSERV